MSHKSDTPRTDKFQPGNDGILCWQDFARQLERELNSALLEIKACRSCLIATSDLLKQRRLDAETFLERQKDEQRKRLRGHSHN